MAWKNEERIRTKEEGYAFIKKAVEATKEEMDGFRSYMFVFWMNVRGKKVDTVQNYSTRKQMELMQEHACKIIKNAEKIVFECNRVITAIDNGFIKED